MPIPVHHFAGSYNFSRRIMISRRAPLTLVSKIFTTPFQHLTNPRPSSSDFPCSTAARKELKNP
jgi:hypothetical protein